MSQTPRDHARSKGSTRPESSRGRRNEGEALRLAPALLELFPDRVMLSSRELSEVVRLESCGVPLSQLLAWAREMNGGRRGQRLSALLHQLSQRATRWRTAHIGDKYQQEVARSDLEIEQAISGLIAEVRRAKAELHEPDLRIVLSWLTEQLVNLKRRALLAVDDPHHLTLPSVFKHLRSLDEELRERTFIVLPLDIQKRIQARTHTLLEREANRARPQDFMIAQREVYWMLLSDELGLPAVRLTVFDQW